MTPAAIRHVPNWFERKFEFIFPVELYPMLRVRLGGTPPRLEEMMRGATGERLLQKSGSNWSAQEHAGHLLDLEPLWIARLNDFLENRDTLAVADLTNRKTHEAGHNNRRLAEILAEFRTARAGLLKRVETLEGPALLDRSILHPRLKQRMRLVDHLHFIAEHDDHHLAKIWELVGHE